MNNSINQFKFFAFISYNSKDVRWGKKLQRKLEHYRMPATLCSEHNWENKTPMKPVFFAPTDIQPGGLTAELQERLKASRNLIVICSPNSAKSEWVGKEIEYFHSLGRTDNIHFFIVDGKPHSGDEATECFNPIVNTLGIPEILGANIHEKVSRLPWINRERAYVQLITKLLGIDFDTLWNRHRRLMIRQSVMGCLAIVVVAAAISVASSIHRPVDVSFCLNESTPENKYLPPLEGASLSLILENERKDTTIMSINDKIVFSNIPAGMIGKQARVLFTCENYKAIDTMIMLDENVLLNVSRDPNAYGHVTFTLYDAKVKPVPNTKLSLDGIETISDENGKVEVLIPLEQQKKVYYVSSTEVVLQDTLKDAKCGANDAIFCY